jgi:hypothetical protein
LQIYSTNGEKGNALLDRIEIAGIRGNAVTIWSDISSIYGTGYGHSAQLYF